MDGLTQESTNEIITDADNDDNQSKKSLNENQNTPRNITNLTKFEYKTNTFLLIKFGLLVFILLPIQYHHENFNIQLKIARDFCLSNTNPKFNPNYSTFTLADPDFLDKIDNEISFINTIQQDQLLNNYVFKYLTYADCINKNLTNVINTITVRPIMLQNFDEYNGSNMTVIVICSDDAYLKFVEKNVQIEELNDKIDFQTNILDQWKASCKNTSMTTSSVSYAQLTYLSGQILGAIGLSILADILGCKKVYLTSMYLATIIGVLISIVQTYRQYILVRLPIAALIQGAFIASFVLMYELVMKTSHRTVYCCLFLSFQYISNTFIACLSLVIKDWRYMQLAGSLLSSVAILYPWVLQDSLKWFISKRKFLEAEKTWASYFINENAVSQLIRFKTDEKLNDEFKQSSWWPILIWQPQFRKIILIFVLIWSILSFSYFFLNEDQWDVFTGSVHNFILSNLLLAIFNMLMIVVCLKFGKRFPLGSCMLLSGIFSLVLSLLNSNVNNSWWRLILHIMTKCLLNFSLNILILYVCEIFPCEIKCSSISFFLSIKYLSEMFAIYMFKTSTTGSILILKIGLSIFCILLCACGLLLPDKNLFPFNMDYIDFVNNLNDFIECVPQRLNNSLQNITFEFKPQQINEELVSIESEQIKEKISETNDDNAVVSYAANNLITKINSENHSKNGKLNPLYEEDMLNSYGTSKSIQTKVQINYIDVLNFTDVSTKF